MQLATKHFLFCWDFADKLITKLFPHFAGDIFFFGACSVGVDGGGGELGVAEPFLEEVEGDAGGDADAVAEAFGGGVEAGSPAACMRAWMARQPVMRDQGQRRIRVLCRGGPGVRGCRGRGRGR